MGLLPCCQEPHNNKHQSTFSVHAGRVPLYMPDGGAHQGRQPHFHFCKGGSPLLPCLTNMAGPVGEPTPSSYHPRWCCTTQTKSSYLSPPQPAVKLPQQWYYPICMQWSVQSTCNKPCNLRAIAIFVQLQSACTCNTSSNRHTNAPMSTACTITQDTIRPWPATV